MKPFAMNVRQRGATLVIGLIMLTAITLLVTSTFLMSNSNLQSVGNSQFRDESVAAANKAVEQVLATSFYTAPTADQITVDINNDGVVDYTVDVGVPTCLRGAAISTAMAAGSGSSMSLGFAAAPNEYNTVWDIDATVTDARSGTAVRVHQGVRKRLTQAQLDAVCP